MSLLAWVVTALGLIACGSNGASTHSGNDAAASGGASSSSGGSSASGGATSSSGGSSASGGETSSSGGSSAGGGAAGSNGAGGAGGTAATNPSGQPMPASDLPGWKLIFSDDFVTDVPVGSFPGPAYSAGWTAYPEGWHDTSGNGEYSPQRTLSVKGGVLIIDVHTENGVHWVSAPEPILGKGQLYGRYSVRFRATQTTSDYKTAWLLWPDSEKWPDDGEIDFPEGNLNGTMQAFAHYADPNGGQDAFSSGVSYTGWHTATTEWSQGQVKFILDGKTIGTSTTEVPSKSMHYVMQTETNLDGIVPSDTSAGIIQVDWVAIWAKI